MNATKHIAGEMIDGVQNCILCGEPIFDINGKTSSGGFFSFAPGEVYVIKNGNRTDIQTNPPKEITINNCSK